MYISNFVYFLLKKITFTFNLTCLLFLKKLLHLILISYVYVCLIFMLSRNLGNKKDKKEKWLSLYNPDMMIYLMAYYCAIFMIIMFCFMFTQVSYLSYCYRLIYT